jgi:hypothetical protein
MSFLQEVWGHKLLTVRALLIGWFLLFLRFWLREPVFPPTIQLSPLGTLFLAFFDDGVHLWYWITSLVPLTVPPNAIL